jgi:hypothetical protein
MSKERQTELKHKVSDTNLYHCWTTFVSQPKKYVAMLLLFQFGMLLYFIFTRKAMEAGIIAVTSIIYAISTITQLLIPFVDPGIIPKILLNYDE